MNEAKKILSKLLEEAQLSAHAQTFTRDTLAGALVIHPITGERAEFCVSARAKRDLRAIANMRSRIRRFGRIGCDLFAGQSYSGKQATTQANKNGIGK